MPHTKSAEKALRQAEKRRAHNRDVKKAIKVQFKKFSEALAKGTPEQKVAEFKLASKKLDKAAAKKVIHPNAAARKKSQLAKKLGITKAK
ncbi:30S ribosomal protein S20 [Telmatocola sphagniphila]|jgi:small subunit ribosomal protein S20|uniref:Small ribosomal subunit protein bS20 n=1 Tax=Telmatocola sphagniphila TaxID=1123043 RepID=A0A8E6BB30_9BACT|nr:30S ribosomal protein S20 [Telmatocola sphagniphila]QVL34461.1 30S ribosomal protein S20 [Telmatocola sphagniphila]